MVKFWMLTYILSSTVFAMNAPSKGSGIDCSTSQVNGKSIVSVKLPKKHGGDFAIKNPKGDFFFIAFNQPDKKSVVQPILSASMFKKLQTLKVKIADAKGFNWSEKSGGKKHIFVEKGIYRLVVAPTLETEDPVLDGWCDVRYEP